MRLSRHLPGIREREWERSLSTTIWTIGHGDRTFDDIERQLAEHGIMMVVDVRAEPDDPRAPEFSRRRLEDLASDAGLGYRWMGASLSEDSPIAPGGGFDDLVALASASSTVILGREPDAILCRRSIAIAPALQARGIDVVHILPDGSTRRHESPLPFEQ